MKTPACPSCTQPMLARCFPRHDRGEVELDFCFACQGIWFDEFESLQLAPGGVVELFRLLHERQEDAQRPLATQLPCPRCGERMLHGLDVSRHGGRFNYYRCLQGHGRFITFGQFMTEKGFVRQLNPAEVRALAARVGVVRCTGCGAPVDIRQEAACGHCRAPIAILDPAAVEVALARFRDAETRRSAAPDVSAVADAILAREKEKSRRERQRFENLDRNTDIADLVLAGVDLVWTLLRR